MGEAGAQNQCIRVGFPDRFSRKPIDSDDVVIGKIEIRFPERLIAHDFVKAFLFQSTLRRVVVDFSEELLALLVQRTQGLFVACEISFFLRGGQLLENAARTAEYLI